MPEEQFILLWLNILLFTFVMRVIAFTNVSKIYILGKQDYKKSKKEVKSQKQRAEKKNSAIGIQVKKIILSSMY